VWGGRRVSLLARRWTQAAGASSQRWSSASSTAGARVLCCVLCAVLCWVVLGCVLGCVLGWAGLHWAALGCTGLACEPPPHPLLLNALPYTSPVHLHSFLICLPCLPACLLATHLPGCLQVQGCPGHQHELCSDGEEPGTPRRNRQRHRCGRLLCRVSEACMAWACPCVCKRRAQ